MRKFMRFREKSCEGAARDVTVMLDAHSDAIKELDQHIEAVDGVRAITDMLAKDEIRICADAIEQHSRVNHGQDEAIADLGKRIKDCEHLLRCHTDNHATAQPRTSYKACDDYVKKLERLRRFERNRQALLGCGTFKTERTYSQRFGVQDHFCSTEPPHSQLQRLGGFILREIEGEPSASEGAVDTAIRLIRDSTRYTRTLRAIIDERDGYARPQPGSEWGRGHLSGLDNAAARAERALAGRDGSGAWNVTT